MKDKYLMIYMFGFVAILLWSLVIFFDYVINFNPGKADVIDWMLIIGVSSILIQVFFILLFNTPIVRILGKEKAEKKYL
tara:strand:- start:2752 stop:2988 length:237 start_codon:yes stop_codon:yes gene_type:complete